MEGIDFPLRSSSGAGTGRPAALPRISSRFGFVILVFLSETTGCHTEVWGTEKLTGKQTGRQTMYEQMMSIVRGRGEGGKGRGFTVLLRGEHTYPVRLNQQRVVEEDGREGGARGRMGGRRAEKTGWRKREEARSAGIKGKKTLDLYSGTQMTCPPLQPRLFFRSGSPLYKPDTCFASLFSMSYLPQHQENTILLLTCRFFLWCKRVFVSVWNCKCISF